MKNNTDHPFQGSYAVLQLIKQMLHVKPQKRPTIQDVLRELREEAGIKGIGTYFSQTDYLLYASRIRGIGTYFSGGLPAVCFQN